MLPLCQVARRGSICPLVRGMSLVKALADLRDYFFIVLSLLPNFWRNFSTRPPVSMIFWVPV